jgi:hypothetical protein
MPADEPRHLSRRATLAGLAGLLAASCGRVAFMAANVPAAFGAYRRHPDIAYGPDPQHRLDFYVPDARRRRTAQRLTFPCKTVVTKPSAR